MAQVLPQARQVDKEPKKKIELPGDYPTRLFVTAQAANIVIHKIHTADALDNRILKADVESFSKDDNPDISFSRRLKYKQDRYGKVRNIPTERILKRPPNILMLFIVGFAVLAMVWYGQSSPIISSQVQYIFYYYWADVTALVFLVVGLMAWAAITLRGRKKGA